MSRRISFSQTAVPISRYMLHHLMQTYGEVAGLPVEKRTFHCLSIRLPHTYWMPGLISPL